MFVSQQFPHPPAQQQPLPVAAKPSNGLGLTGFILGLVGLVFSLIPLVGVIAWPLVILGVIFCIIGLVKVKNKTATNKGLAITGLVASVVGLGMCVTWVVIAGQAINEVQDKATELKNEWERPAKTVYELTGTAKEADVSYGEVLNPKQETVTALPWKKEMEVKGVLKGGTLMATIGEKGGSLTCKMIVDGKVVDTKTQSGAFKVLTCQGK
ncbi:MmpS family transport accessory protein [Crossiella sp. S99.2]|uniref:MmpS family transport accessory protein n=1 Tax=Crossiella sp. S99.2 TaxID=2936272 RepID=UPI0035AC26E9